MWLVAFGAFAGTVAGQVADTTKMPPPAVVAGRVVDTAGAALADAEIVVRTEERIVVDVVQSNARGSFALRSFPLGGSYTIVARKIGYRPAMERRNIYLQRGDTLQLWFELLPVVVGPTPASAGIEGAATWSRGISPR